MTDKERAEIVRQLQQQIRDAKNAAVRASTAKTQEAMEKRK